MDPALETLQISWGDKTSLALYNQRIMKLNVNVMKDQSIVFRGRF